MSYENLVGIDSAYCLMTLTHGLILRFNPLELNQQEAIRNNLDELKSKNSLFVVVGSELVQNRNESQHENENQVKKKQRIGHSFSLIDFIKTKSGDFYVKLRNCLTKVQLLFDKDKKLDENVYEFIEIDKKKYESDKDDGIFYLKMEDFFKYFEIMSSVVLSNRDASSK
jgi:hypothetical protein